MLKGVITIASTVEIADMLMDKGVFPRARYVQKLDKFPPGQAATKNNPRAILGLGCMMRTRRYVNAGSKINWQQRPITAGFGFLTLCLKSANFKSSATPNMMNPIKIFMIVKEVSLKFKWISSIFILLTPWFGMHFFKIFQAWGPHMLDWVYIDMNDGADPTLE